MREGEFSRTALSACALRVVHRRFDKPCLFDDPLAEKLLGRRDSPLVRLPQSAFAADARSFGTLLTARSHIVGRAVFAESALSQAIEEWGGGKYLILGAGLDSFAWRRGEALADVPVFEIDHPSTQAEKRRRTASWSSPGAHVFLPVDFNRDSLSEALRPWLDAANPKPVFVSWLGVTPYLPRKAVASTLEELAKVLPSGSRVALDFATDFRRVVFGSERRRDMLGAGLMAVGVRFMGERFYNHGMQYEDWPEFWRSTGWETRELLTTADVAGRFFTPVGSHLRMIPGSGLALLEL